jgi:hypothetical protein
VAVGAGGRTVFVTGSSSGAQNISDFTTIAYSADTGRRLWLSRYSGVGYPDSAVAVVASSTGTEVFVTGQVDTSMGGSGYATVAYNAATGGQLWAKQYGGPANWYAAPRSMTISRTGQTVFVTGYAHMTKSRVAYATVAYNAATGAELLARRYIAPGGRNGDAAAIGVSPSGRTVFVTGETYVTTPRETYTTVGYNAVTGAQLWARHYNASGIDATAALAVSPRGDAVFVAGAGYGGFNSGFYYATIAYRG